MLLTERFAPALRAAGFEGAVPPPQFWPVLVHEAAKSENAAVSD